MAASDFEFVVSNKVSRIVNCAGRQVQNQWTHMGVQYLNYFWMDNESQILFDNSDRISNEIFCFIDEAMVNYESVLVHSVKGQSRSSCAIATFLMQKYKWSLLKTLEFLN